MGSLFLFLLSCQFFEKNKVCKIGDAILYEEEINTIWKYYYNDLDSVEARERIIEKWITQQQIKLELEGTSPELKLKNDYQIQEDLMQLNLFNLENHYITNHIDSTIQENEIQAFYEKHRENYKTQSFIVRALYIEVPDTIAKSLKLAEYYLLKNDKDRDQIEKIANLYATNFYFEESAWIYIDDLLRGVAISSDEKDMLVKQRGKMILAISGNTHFINILDYRVKTISSPMEVEQENIKNDILKRRVNQLRENAKETILEDVKKKYPVTYY